MSTSILKVSDAVNIPVWPYADQPIHTTSSVRLADSAKLDITGIDTSIAVVNRGTRSASHAGATKVAPNGTRRGRLGTSSWGFYQDAVSFQVAIEEKFCAGLPAPHGAGGGGTSHPAILVGIRLG